MSEWPSQKELVEIWSSGVADSNEVSRVVLCCAKVRRNPVTDVGKPQKVEYYENGSWLNARRLPPWR